MRSMVHASTPEKASMRQLAAFVLVAVFATLPGFTCATDDLSSSFDEVMSLLTLDPSVKHRALAGEIVMINPDDSTEN